jgi:hypothetical protein
MLGDRPPTEDTAMAPVRRLAALATALVFLAPGSALGADPDFLPAAPSAGLRVTVSVGCDFDDRWWEVALQPGTDLPLEIRTRSPRMFGARERTSERSIEPAVRDALYGLVREAFAEFRIDRAPDFSGPGADRAWTGERTISLAAMVLDDELGRVDRIDLAIDVMRGRSVPAATLALIDALAEQTGAATLDLDCR